jgi:hypothetical protein
MSEYRSLFLPSHFFLHCTSVDLFNDKIESSVRPYDSELCQSGSSKSVTKRSFSACCIETEKYCVRSSYVSCVFRACLLAFQEKADVFLAMRTGCPTTGASRPWTAGPPVLACDPDLAFASSLESILHYPRILNRGSDYLALICEMDPASSNSMSIPNPLRDVPLHETASNASGVGATEGTAMGALNPAEDADEWHKRTALAGQWRTPENLLFPATVGSFTSLANNGSAGASTSTFLAATGGADAQRTSDSLAPSGGVVGPNNNPPASTTTFATATAMVVDSSTIGNHMMPLPQLQAMELPDSTEDYAKALQEAYRRGAEAAAALAAQQQQQQQQFNLAPSASCPDFQQAYSAPSGTVTGQRTSPPLPASSSGYVAAPQTVVSAPYAPQPVVTTSGVAAPHVPSPISAPTMTTSASHPVLTSLSLMQMQVPQQVSQQQQQQQQQPALLPPYQHHPMMPPPPPPAPSTFSSVTLTSTVATAPAPPPYQPMQVHAQPATASTSAPASMVRNSLSMPNMSGGAGPGVGLAHHPNPYHAGLVEEEKRLKRLARNRASARLRRLRKKNLVRAFVALDGQLFSFEPFLTRAFFVSSITASTVRRLTRTKPKSGSSKRRSRRSSTTNGARPSWRPEGPRRRPRAP